jgi:hypothetical protein
MPSTNQNQTTGSRRVGRSVLAVLAGFIATVVLSYGTDAVLTAAGVLPAGGKLPLTGSKLLVATVLAYRVIFSVVGCYIAARLAPSRPMTHALVLGTLGFLASLGGAFSMATLAPSWYAWGIVVLALPAAWLGGKLYTMTARVNN